MSIFKHALTIQIVERWWRQTGPSIAHDIKVLWSILTEVADNCTEVTACVLDGVDQALTEGMDFFMHNDNQLYTDSRETPKLRLIITRRPYFNRDHGFKVLIKNLRPSVYSIGSENVDQDTILLIHSRAAELELSDTARGHLVDLLLKRQKESRTFLWVRLIFHYLEREPQYENAGPPQVDRLWKSLPKELDQMNEDMLKTTNRKLARMVFHILIGAREPLQLSTLRTLLSLSDDIDTLTMWGIGASDETFERILGNLCSLLVTVTDSKVHFIHPTVNDFLLDERSVHDRPRDKPVFSFRRSFHPIDSNLLLSDLCSSHLIDLDLTVECDPYVARHWLSHHRHGLYTVYHYPGPTHHPRNDWSIAVPDIRPCTTGKWADTIGSLTEGLSVRLEFPKFYSFVDWNPSIDLLRIQQRSNPHCDVACEEFRRWQQE